MRRRESTLGIDQGIYSGRQFAPGFGQGFVVFNTVFGERKIFAGRPAGAFLPAVGEHAGIFKTGEHGVKRAFQNVQVGRAHLLYNIAGVSFASADYGQNAELVDAFAHLRLGVVYVHKYWVFFRTVNCKDMVQARYYAIQSSENLLFYGIGFRAFQHSFRPLNPTMLMKKPFLSAAALALLLAGGLPRTLLAQIPHQPGSMLTPPEKASKDAPFQVAAEAFADIQMLRYQVPGFAELPLQQKQLAYYLYEAALAGRDIIWDQKSPHGLTIRRTLEGIWRSYSGPRKGADWDAFYEYSGRVFFSNGTHHHYGNEKFFPKLSEAAFKTMLQKSDAGLLPFSSTGETLDAFWTRIRPVIYDPKVEPKLVDLGQDKDNVKASSVNFYEGVTQSEVDTFYAKFNSTGNAPSWGLNSKTMKDASGKIVERVWKSGGMYGAAIDRIVYWLERAVPVAENAQQQKALELLIKFYQTGDLKAFDDYSIAWAADVNSRIDVVNGFIEVYMDPIGKKGSVRKCGEPEGYGGHQTHCRHCGRSTVV